MFLKSALSLLTWISFATNVQSGLIPKSASPGTEVSAPDLQPRLAPAIEERAPSLLKRDPTLLSEYELRVLQQLSYQIRNKLKKNDLVLFIGNSAGESFLLYMRSSVFTMSKSYLIYPFDEGSYNMHSLPISKTKIYGTDDDGGKGRATNKGLDGYWDRVLQPRLAAKDFDRIVIIDHSGTGRSVDGFRKAFKDIVNRAKDQKKIPGDQAKKIIDTPWYFINVIDWRRRPDSSIPVQDPKTKAVKKISKVTLETKDGTIDKILADKDAHPRVTCEYWASRWEKSVGSCWTDDGGKAAADEQRKAIKDWCKDTSNGGLLSPTNPPQEPKQEQPKPSKPKDKKIASYEDNKYKYTIYEKADGSRYTVRKSKS